MFFRPRPEPPKPDIEAREYDGKTMTARALFDWSNGQVCLYGDTLYVNCEHGRKKVSPSDYVVKVGPHRFDVIARVDMHRKYDIVYDAEPAKPEDKQVIEYTHA